jgi:hypothetical protein
VDDDETMRTNQCRGGDGSGVDGGDDDSVVSCFPSLQRPLRLGRGFVWSIVAWQTLTLICVLQQLPLLFCCSTKGGRALPQMAGAPNQDVGLRSVSDPREQGCDHSKSWR